VSTYSSASRRFASGLPERCIKDATEITREDLREYCATIAAHRTPAGVSVDYRAPQQFFKWADEVEDESRLTRWAGAEAR
jgi:acetyl esterase/lipase